MNKSLLSALQAMGVRGGFYYNYHRQPIALTFEPWPRIVTGLPVDQGKWDLA